MKRIVYSFLLIALFGCGYRSELKNDHVRILYRDSTRHDFYLLSVRDSSLVVAPGEYNYRDSIQAIPFSNIVHVYHSNSGKAYGTAAGGLAGCGVGIATSLLVVHEPTLGAAVFIGLVLLATTPTGAIVGCAVSHDTDEALNLADPDDLAYIKHFSRYIDGEPPELKNIK